MRTIQFFGLPGSGKTYLLNKIREELQRNKVSIVVREELIVKSLQQKDEGFITGLVKKMPSTVWYRVKHEDYCLQEFLDFTGKNFPLSTFVFKLLEKSDVLAEQLRSALGAFARTSIECEMFFGKETVTSHDILLADEWFYHRLYTIFANCLLYPTAEQVKEFVSYVPDTEGTVFIATPPELCVTRMRQRKHIPQFLSKYSFEEMEEVLSTYYNLFELLFSVLKAENKSVIKYDGVSSQLDQIADYCLTPSGRS